MNVLNLSENLASLRRKKQITQEELAAFIGVTKASVSKWETGQSMPDILLLPQLAAYFDVSVDDLLGYAPQLSQEQIRRVYLHYTAEFARRPFDEVLGEVHSTIHQYYSCYPLLLQMCVLYLNHFSLTKKPEEAQGILREAYGLCGRIVQNCKNAGICNDAISIRALLDLQFGRTDEVIEALEEVCDPIRFSGQNNAVLIQAYQLSGKTEQAIDYAQITIYQHLLSLFNSSMQYLAVNMDGREGCEETIRRMDCVAEAYRLKTLHPNVMAQFYYQSALCLMQWKEYGEAIKKLEAYENVVRYLSKDGNCKLHGDDYFTRIEGWIDKLALGASPPRDQDFLIQTALQSLESPAFAPLYGTKPFECILKRLKGET